MKLLFFGGGHFESNIELNLELIKLTEKVYPSITYIPDCSYYGKKDFKDFVAHYEHYDFSNFFYFEVDEPFTSNRLETALSSDIIYLSGGNTFYFLNALRKSGMVQKLKDFVAKGGLLCGLSAGGILMTPNINTAGVPSFDRDPNEVGLVDYQALNLVHFEFFPHFEHTKRYRDALSIYSESIDYPLYGVPDGGGIIVDDHKLIFIGDVFGFFGGYNFKVG